MKRIAEKMFEFDTIAVSFTRSVHQSRHQAQSSQPCHGGHLEQAEVEENIAEDVAQPGVLPPLRVIGVAHIVKERL